MERKIALVIDGVANISNPKEKEAIKSIVKMNNKLKRFPIIIITSNKHSKTVNELKKMVTIKIKKDGKRTSRKIINVVVLGTPGYYEMEIFVKNICKQEGLHIVTKKSDEEDIYIEIINHAQHDVRRLVNVLEELKLMVGDSDLTLDVFEQYCETSKKKDLDPGIYQATQVLLNQYSGIDDSLILYGEERATIPLMVHENYLLNIKNQYSHLSIDDQIDLVHSISKSISESDRVDGLIYSNQCWNLQPVHGFFSCVLPSFHINKYPNKFSKVEKYRYTQEYNKTSIKKINNKVIKKAQENQFLKRVSIYDFLYMASILKTLLNRGDFDQFANLMIPYHLKFKEIESIIKIDKIKKSKNVLTGKKRSIIKDLLGVDE